MNFLKLWKGSRTRQRRKYGDEGYVNFLKLLHAPYLAMCFSGEDDNWYSYTPVNYVFEIEGNQLYCGEILEIDEKTLELNVEDRSECESYTFVFLDSLCESRGQVH